MMKSMSRLTTVLVAPALGIAAVLVLAGIIAASAYFGVWWGTPKPTIVRSIGPTIQQLEGMGQLVSLRVHVTDVLVAESDVYRGSWLIKGDALLACDMSKAAISDVDHEKQTALITLPKPQVLSPRVDHEKTRTWDVKRATWLPWKWSSQDAFRDSAMYHAQRLVEEAAKSHENFATAKSNAELILRKTYDNVDWRIRVAWNDAD